MLCTTPGAAQRQVNNKIEIYNWMGQANTVIDYYEGFPGPNGSPSPQR